MKTILAKKKDIKPTWYLVDASGKTLGRLAAKIVTIIRGKNKPLYTPNLNLGDKVTFLGSENIWVPMEHHEYSDTATIGNPFRGTKEKGEKYFQISGEALAAFIEEVKKFDIKVADEKRLFANRA